MALALTEFEALCAFVPHAELLESLEACPELAECCGSRCVEGLQAAASAPDGSPQRTAALRAAFHEVMACPPERAAAFVARMCERLKADAAAGRQLSPRELLSLRLELQVGAGGALQCVSSAGACRGWVLHCCSAVRLQDGKQLAPGALLQPARLLPNPLQYPGDVGVLAAWFLNYLRLQPGQAVALPANEPHAYISGEIVEVMATSGEQKFGWRGWGCWEVERACWFAGPLAGLPAGAAACLMGASSAAGGRTCCHVGRQLVAAEMAFPCLHAQLFPAAAPSCRQRDSCGPDAQDAGRGGALLLPHL